MIAPQELRIGNWATIDNPKAWPKLKDIPLKIIGISTNMDRLDKELFPNSEAEILLQGNLPYSQFSEFIKPIELTEEWLLRMGFEKKAEHNYRMFILHRGIIHAYTSGKVEIELGNKTGYSFGYPRVRYVHQLQNLVHSLTGEELQLKN